MDELIKIDSFSVLYMNDKSTIFVYQLMIQLILYIPRNIIKKGNKKKKDTAPFFVFLMYLYPRNKQHLPMQYKQ